MKSGNVTGNVYRRSIYHKLNCGKNEKSAVTGENCAFFLPEFPSDGFFGEPPQGGNGGAGAAGVRIAAAMSHTSYPGETGGKYAVYAAANQAAAAGAARLSGVLLRILLPSGAPEQLLGRIAKGAREAADELGIPVLDAKAQVSFGITVPLTSAAALGGAKAGDKAPEQGREQGSGKDGREGPEDRQVVMTKWAGLEGSAILADLCGEKLRERYPAWLLEEARGMEGFLSVCKEAEIAAKAGADALCAAAEGGIFHALWTLAQRAGVGLDIDLKKIPIRQETVEICNALDRNPYGLLSNGSLLCLTPRGDRLVRALQEEGIPAAVIGFAADGNDRVVRNGEETRFLEPAGEDEIYQIWKEKVWI